MKRVLPLIPFLTLAIALSANAQTTPFGADAFAAEAAALGLPPAPGAPFGWGPEAEYDLPPADLDGEATFESLHGGAEPADSPERPASLSFDPEALTDLPFGITTVDDPALLHFLEFYATEGRRRMSNWLARSGRYREHLAPLIEESGMPSELFWVIAIESGFDPTAVSDAGAEGLWQFMSDTGRSYGLRIDRTVDERRDPFASTRAAMEYFERLHERFGSWPLALAAYNAGHGHVRSQLREGNLTDFWELESYGAVYTNARRYALRAITVAIIDRNRDAMGYEEVMPDPLWTFDEVEVPGGVRLSLLGEAIDRSAEELAVENPSLVGLRTPGDVDTWTLRLPAGTHDTFVSNYDRLSRRYGEEHTEVVLRFGETVEALAEQYDIPPRVLRSINGLAYDAPSPYGTVIMVPARAEREEPEAPETLPIVLVPQTRFAFADRERVFYQTQPGDTVERIATHFGVDVHHLAAWNDLDASGGLVSELTLQVFVDPTRDWSDTLLLREDQVQALALNSPEWVAWQEAEEAASARRRRYYTVRRGDTVMEIAARFGVRSRDIIRWNELGDEAMIVIGQRLVVGR